MTRLLWLWVLLLIASLIIGPWWYSNNYCCNNVQAASQNENARVIAPATPTPEATTPEPEADFVARFSVTDGLDFKVASPDRFSFNRSLAVPNIPGSMMTALEKIANYLKINPSRLLTLTGYYAEDEENATTFENLGLARANALKSKLVALGVPEASLKLGSLMSTDLSFANGILDGGVGFEFGGSNLGDTESVNEAKALETLGNTLKAGPLRINFETSSSTIIRTDELNTFLKNAKYYMSKVPAAKLAITGHTDSDGRPERNQVLSEKRANSTRAWLGQNGLDVSRISTSGKGEREPIGDNNTAAGKELNRRAEAIIIE